MQQDRRGAERLDAVHHDMHEIGRRGEPFQPVPVVGSGQLRIGQAGQPGEGVRLLALPVVGERGDVRVVGRLEEDVPDLGRLALEAEAPAALDVELVDERRPQVSIGHRRRVEEFIRRQLGGAIKASVAQPVQEPELDAMSVGCIPRQPATCDPAFGGLRCGSSLADRSGFGSAPTIRSTTAPSRITSIVGMLRAS